MKVALSYAVKGVSSLVFIWGMIQQDYRFVAIAYVGLIASWWLLLWSTDD